MEGESKGTRESESESKGRRGRESERGLGEISSLADE